MAISDAQFTAWLLSDNADRCVLTEMDYQYESAGAPATGTLRFSDKVYFNDTYPYVAAITGIPEYTRSLGGNQLGTYSSSTGTLELDNADGSQDALLTYAIDGSAIRFYLGDVSWARSDFRFIFSVLSLKAIAPSFDRISVQLKDTGVLLDKSIGGTIKVGGTGPNADQWRAVNFGLVHQVECKVKDSTLLTYVHSDTGVGLAVSSGPFVFRDRGVVISVTDNGDGTVTLLASPDGTVTALLNYVFPAAETEEYHCVSDAMLHFVGQRSGLSALGLYAGPGPTFSTRPVWPTTGAWLLAGGEDYQIGISIADRRNVLDLLGDLVASGLCFWAITRFGLFTFGRLRPNYIAGLGLTAAHTITEDDLLPSADGGTEANFSIDRMEPQYFQLQATMQKNWSIQTDLATSLTENEHAALTRSGLYVLQNQGVGTDYANAPELYNKTLVQSPTIETLLSWNDDNPLLVGTAPTILQFWMETRRAMNLPWINIASATVGIEFYDVELGDPVTVMVPRFGYDAGVDFQVISTTIKLPNKVDLKMIRRHVQGPYASRTTVPPPDPPFFLLKQTAGVADGHILQLNGDKIIIH